ncbi:UNVERIFIED_CONTAM: hypothetical protein FKN15_045685 [Acipenser sinensis]
MPEDDVRRQREGEVERAEVKKRRMRLGAEDERKSGKRGGIPVGSEQELIKERRMAANMYRVGDYVYFENSSSNPYLIRRIEELNKTANGNVEAKVVSLFRRRDISSNLNGLADSNAREFEEESKQPVVSEQQGHQLKHRELFLSRQFESLPATHIRGKCNVTLLNETDVLAGYLEREDCFFYSLVFDPVQKTLLADQGEIRVGSKYQAEIPDKLPEVESDTRNQLKLETKVWDPDNPLTDRQIDQFLVVARSHGNLWPASSSFTTCGKLLTATSSRYCPYCASCVEGGLLKRLKAAEADSKLKQVYIPTYTKPNPNQIMPVGSKPGVNGAAGFQKGLSCESCHTSQSAQWYAWGPPNMQCRLCASCWIYWKKYGGLKTPTQLEGAARTATEAPPRGHMTRQEVQGLSPFTSSAGRAKLLAKNRQTFILQTTKLTRIARRVIRLPKAPKLPLKVRAAVRPTLATIVKELAIQAPLKLKAPRGTPTPINRNQLNQSRASTNILGVKRPFENVGTPLPHCRGELPLH